MYYLKKIKVEENISLEICFYNKCNIIEHLSLKYAWLFDFQLQSLGTPYA